jgi:prophage DNA circulation protein
MFDVQEVLKVVEMGNKLASMVGAVSAVKSQIAVLSSAVNAVPPPSSVDSEQVLKLLNAIVALENSAAGIFSEVSAVVASVSAAP